MQKISRVMPMPSLLEYFSHESITGLAEHASVPVVNALCDLYHPCQALADFVTLAEQFDELTEVKVAYVGDGNNVSNSLKLVAAILGVISPLLAQQVMALKLRCLPRHKHWRRNQVVSWC